MDADFLKTTFVLAHIFGAVVGAGGAFYSDIVFMKSLKDKRIDKVELSFLKTMGTAVWVGLSLLIISGVGLFFLDPAKYLASSKFISKMMIVGIIAINGIFFHLIHIPFMAKRAKLRKYLLTGTTGHQDVKLILSGVVSMVSWSCALILGSLQSIPLQPQSILGIYMLLIFIGSISSTIVMKRMLNHTAKYAIGTVSVGILGASAGLLLL